VLNVYLPAGYDPSDTVTYPVVYLLDGGSDEDFIHVTGLYQFHAFPWVDHVPSSIVVGIANTDRRRDFTFPSSLEDERTRFPTSGGSAAFIRFVADELQPLIDRTYKTRGMRTLIGQSMAGLLATELLLTRPDRFSHYILVSPSLWWDDGSLLHRPVTPAAHPVRVHIAVGKEGLSPSASPHVMEVDANLLAEKLRDAGVANLTVTFDYLPEENHATAAHPAIDRALRVLYR
jgi:predicted alpha/beta superfamily hydrolase